MENPETKLSKPIMLHQKIRTKVYKINVVTIEKIGTAENNFRLTIKQLKAIMY